MKLHADARIAKMAEVGRLALADLAPARIGIAKTDCRNVSFIRRYRMKDGSVRTNPGITNHAVKEPLGASVEALTLDATALTLPSAGWRARLKAREGALMLDVKNPTGMTFIVR